MRVKDGGHIQACYLVVETLRMHKTLALTFDRFLLKRKVQRKRQNWIRTSSTVRCRELHGRPDDLILTDGRKYCGEEVNCRDVQQLDTCKRMNIHNLISLTFMQMNSFLLCPYEREMINKTSTPRSTMWPIILALSQLLLTDWIQFFESSLYTKVTFYEQGVIE